VVLGSKRSLLAWHKVEKGRSRMQVKEFENTVWETEGIRIVIRAPEDQQVNDYDKDNAAPESWTLNEWLEKRVLPCLADGTGVAVISGDGTRQVGQSKIKKVRNSYKE
jgi:hypothetical protein